MMVILLTIAAFPIYQATRTGGPIFYTTNADEASHLAYWYANFIIEDSGRLRESSRLVRQLHLLGLSGGYINLLLDIGGSIAILLSLTQIFRRIGCSKEIARSAALLAFTTPVIFTPFNPLLAWISELRLSTPLTAWLSMANNAELVFLRSPEPQISLVIIALLISQISHPLCIGMALLIASPLLYPFIRIPLLFASAVMIGKRYIGMMKSALIAFVLLGLSSFIFSNRYAPPELRQFFVFSRLPVISLSGTIALFLLLSLRKAPPPQVINLLKALVLSIWAAENVQIISGWLVTPVNYEQYWGTLVLGFIASCVTVYKSTSVRPWLYLSMAIFGLHLWAVFLLNLAVFNRLEHPQRYLQILKESPSRLACSDLYLSTYLDLAFPHKEPTALSWTHTIITGTNSEYFDYECTKQAIRSGATIEVSQFDDIFSQLDNGFLTKGDDLNVTMNRRPLVTQTLPILNLTNCPKKELILCGMQP